MTTACADLFAGEPAPTSGGGAAQIGGATHIGVGAGLPAKGPDLPIQQCKEHIELLDLIESGQREQAAQFLRAHLDHVSRLKAAHEAKTSASST